MFGYLTGKTRRNETRRVANETRRAQEDYDRRRKERDQRKKLELQEQILKLGNNYNTALTQKNNSSNTTPTEDDAIKIASLETDIKTLEDIINKIQREFKGKVNELTLKKQELTQLQTPYNELKSQKGERLDKLKEEILKREIHLNSKYGYNFYTQRNKEELNSGQYWGSTGSPEELSFKRAIDLVKNPNNVKKIINKYKIKSPNTSATATRVNNTTSGGKRNKTIKRK